MDYKAKLLAKVPHMNGWCAPEKAAHIFETVVRTKPDVCLELGVFAGRSLIAFGAGLATIGDKTKLVYGIDAWAVEEATENNNTENANWWKTQVNYEAIRMECENACHEIHVAEYVRLIRADTIRAYIGVTAPIDILHIDGNHSRWNSVRDVTIWVDRVKPGGLIYFDDEDWDTTKNAQELLLLKCDKLEEIRASNICGVYKKR